MSPAIRCLALLLVGWGGVRAATLGIVPGGQLLSLSAKAEAKPVPPRFFPALEPAVPFEAAQPWSTHLAVPAGQAQLSVRPYAVPYFVPALQRQSYAPPVTQGPALYAPIPSMESWRASSFAPLPPATIPAASSAAALPPPPLPAPPKFDRLQLTAWALLRGRQSLGSPPSSLASGGTLGGSQAGARLTYRFTPELAASLRTTSAVGTSQSEVAAGIRVTPLRSLPLSITAERRQAIGHYGGRSAFALFAEGGIYGQWLWGIDLDGYAQGGVVGVRDRAFFADGAFAFTRPVARQFSVGVGFWGGVQPGVYRIDAGPRVSYRIRPNMRVHLDWRQRVAGSALPGSGPALTLAGDF
ncbi:hypothetical protein G7077_08570 [Sphingomonas piscis]|uniref:Uncharacterized protein n=1 Tax=Sphingomonas piscis TaxID=2714943 RepID=A0A6G7YQC5_9SPHN|nr:hypothetical protein [Sphingomonas piscis]QIK78941.1 hypothetical protein G7077_08570 [Sphingomonas piscis]